MVWKELAFFWLGFAVNHIARISRGPGDGIIPAPSRNQLTLAVGGNATAELVPSPSAPVRADPVEVLARLDKQILFYHSLYLQLSCGKQFFSEFLSVEGFNYPDEWSEFVQVVDDEPTSRLAQRYRLFMQSGLGRIQDQVLENIYRNSYLIEMEDDAVFDDLVNKYTKLSNSYKVLFYRWQTEEYSINFSTHRFPQELIQLAKERYIALRKVRQRIMSDSGKLNPSNSSGALLLEDRNDGTDTSESGVIDNHGSGTGSSVSISKSPVKRLPSQRISGSPHI
jgi:hypothetical protein